MELRGCKSWLGSKYKLLGFENNKNLAVIMIIATGKVIRIKLNEVLNSEIMDNLNKMEIKNLYKKFYSQGGAVTAYDLNDRNENSWMIYIILNLLLFTFYIFTSIAATRRKIGGRTRTIAQSCFNSASRKAWLIWSARPLAPVPP